MKKIPVGILGATGMVGRCFVTLLADHPWFELVSVAASPRSVGKIIADLTVGAVEKDINKIAKKVRIVFSALDMEKEDIRRIENAYASLGVAVISNNSAHRWTENVPMIMPEINPGHLQLIKRKGFIVVKPNCSVQSYVPLVTPLLKFQPERIVVTTLQAVSGASRTLENWPEMADNVIPYIPDEEEKSESEPMKIWGKLENGKIIPATSPKISATCIRVPVSDGHMASILVSFKKKPTVKQIIAAWKSFDPLKDLKLPSSPKPFITYLSDLDRPQTRLDRNLGNGMGISVGRLRELNVSDYGFVGLSHNIIRGAAGGAILTAELLVKKGYIDGYYQ